MQTLLWKLENIVLGALPVPRLQIPALEILQGVTAIVGESGAGKSSLLSVLAGFERPDQGHVRQQFQTDRDRLPLYWLPAGEGLWSHLTVRQHLAVVTPRGTDQTQQIADQIDRWLSHFDLMSLADVCPDALSQGERSRLAISRALASQAQVLLLDEPLVHTSLIRQPAYWQTILAAAENRQTSLIMATHDWEAVANYANQVIILDSGRVIYSGPITAARLPLVTESGTQILKRILNRRELAGNGTHVQTK